MSSLFVYCFLLAAQPPSLGASNCRKEPLQMACNIFLLAFLPSTGQQSCLLLGPFVCLFVYCDCPVYQARMPIIDMRKAAGLPDYGPRPLRQWRQRRLQRRHQINRVSPDAATLHHGLTFTLCRLGGRRHQAYLEYYRRLAIHGDGQCSWRAN